MVLYEECTLTSERTSVNVCSEEFCFFARWPYRKDIKSQVRSTADEVWFLQTTFQEGQLWILGSVVELGSQSRSLSCHKDKGTNQSAQELGNLEIYYFSLSYQVSSRTKMLKFTTQSSLVLNCLLQITLQILTLLPKDKRKGMHLLLICSPGGSILSAPLHFLI